MNCLFLTAKKKSDISEKALYLEATVLAISLVVSLKMYLDVNKYLKICEQEGHKNIERIIIGTFTK